RKSTSPRWGEVNGVRGDQFGQTPFRREGETFEMLHDWGVIAAAFGYIGLLFLVASHGDRLPRLKRSRASALIYPLSLAIYCTSWTFFGSVGFASRTSIDFLAIYL